MTRTVDVEVVQGEALFLVAKEYSRLEQVVKEGIQNAIDAGATLCQLDINRQKRNIDIWDNGRGVSFVDFNGALKSVCRSVKAEDSLGQFGIGLVCPLGKCRSFSFATLAREHGHQKAWRWTFDCDSVKKMDKVRIPVEEVNKDVLAASATLPLGVKHWTTLLSIKDYTRDKQINKLNHEEIRNGILTAFGVKMRRHKIVVWITGCDEQGKVLQPIAVKPTEFSGRSLGEWLDPVRRGVESRVNIYVARKGTALKGKVLVGTTDNDFRVSFQAFSRKLEEAKLLPEEVVDALNSGAFEGELLNSHISLEPNRRGFEINDAMVDFCVSIEKWFEEVGKEHIDEEKEKNRNEWLQDVARRSLDDLKNIINASPILRDLVKRFPYGKVGDGHAEKRAVVRKEKEPSLSATPPSKNGADDRERGSGSDHDDVTNHIPYTAMGPKGKRRSLVRGDSQGIHFAHEDSDSLDLHRFDRKYGVVYFNSSHELWPLLEKNEQDLMRFQTLVGLHVLLLEATPEAERVYVRPYTQEVARLLVPVLQQSESFMRSRQVGRPLKKKTT